RWRNHNERLGLPGRNGTTDLLRQMDKKGSFRLVVPVGLLDRAACTPDRIACSARRLSTKCVRRQILLCQHPNGLKIRKFGVADVFKNKGLGPVTNNNPLAMTYQQFSHRPTSK